MTGMVLRRVGAIVSAAALASTLIAGGASSTLAGNTRDIYFGSPPPDLTRCDATTTFCPLVFSPTSATVNPRTFVDVVVSNLGNQTVNHLLALGGAAADTATKNPTPPPPTGNSIPSPLTIFSVTPAPGSAFTCPFTASPASFSCSIGTLASGASAQFRVVLDGIPAVSGTNIPVWFMTSLNESSSTGTNQDEFYATGSVTWTSADCSFNGNYFAPTESISLSQPGACPQPTIISGPNTSIGAFGSVGTFSDPNQAYCVSGFSCFGLVSSANVNFGSGGPVLWSVTWTSKPKGIIHFLDAYPTNPTAYEILPFKNATKCPASPGTLLCWYTLTTSGGLTTAVFQTPANGNSKGY